MNKMFDVRKIGSKFMLKPPMGDDLPQKGYDPGEFTFQPPTHSGEVSLEKTTLY